MTTDARPQLVLSRLSPLPQFGYHTQTDSHMVYWNGVAMSRSQCLLILASVWGMMASSPKMKRAAQGEFMRAYHLGAFGHHDWDQFISMDPAQHLSKLQHWICRGNEQFLTDLRSRYTLHEMLELFKSDNESVIDD